MKIYLFAKHRDTTDRRLQTILRFSIRKISNHVHTYNIL